MQFQDIVYGSFDVSEPVVKELVQSPSLQRLRHVDQVGYSNGFYPNPPNRFQHSLGVYQLLRKFGASLEEQVAGLIHDVSHTVFSHAIEYALDYGMQEAQAHQDSTLKEFVYGSEIPSILERRGFSLESVLDDARHPLKEKPLPELCADRLDYSLRMPLHYHEINPAQATRFLQSISIVNENWVFQDLESAQSFADLFYRMNVKYYTDFEGTAMFQMVGDLIRHALENQYLLVQDLYTTDQLVLEKIQRNLPRDSQLSLFWDRLNRKIGFRNDPNDFDKRVVVKSRIIDPLFVQGGRVERLSQSNKFWKEVVEQESKPKEYFLKFDR